MQMVHATSVEIGGHAVLIRGPSGSGKSDLALRLLDGGAQLVADDQTELTAEAGRLFASAPATIAGMIEVRGLGILRLPHRDRVPLAAVVDLTETPPERLPAPVGAKFLGICVPSMSLNPFHASAAAKVRLLVRATTREGVTLS